ncbi:hypothetical protein [Cupriavidus basilensis]|nr:hypothetical protein [Cupriavidus basilensis]
MAFSIDDTTRTAWSIICSEHSNNTRFNFSTRKYEKLAQDST